MSGNDNTSMTTVARATSHTVEKSDYVILNLAITGNTVVTIPANFGPAGRTLRIYKDAAAFTVTITPTGGLIDGAATKVLAASAAHAATIVSDGVNWYSVSSY